MNQQRMFLKLRKLILKYTLNKNHVDDLPLLNISNCHSVLMYSACTSGRFGRFYV